MTPNDVIQWAAAVIAVAMAAFIVIGVPAIGYIFWRHAKKTEKRIWGRDD